MKFIIENSRVSILNLKVLYRVKRSLRIIIFVMRINLMRGLLIKIKI